jgi:hypothetical protein
MTSEDPEVVLRDSFERTFGQAEYPLHDPFELLPHLPDGPGTVFQAGPVEVPAIDLGMRYGQYQTYPYDSVDELVEDLIRGLKAEGEL